MDLLRRAHFLTKLLLVWFVASVGLAVAAPLLKPQGAELLCTGMGSMKMLVTAMDGSQQALDLQDPKLGTQLKGQLHTSLDCPLCGAVSAPPPVALNFPAVQLALSYALQPLPAARIAARTAAPLQPRGPPSL